MRLSERKNKSGEQWVQECELKHLSQRAQAQIKSGDTVERTYEPVGIPRYQNIGD